MEPAMFPGKVPRYFIVRTLSLFRCEGCKSISLRETNLSEAQVLPKDDWVIDLSSDEFPHSSKLLYSTPKLDYLRINLERLGLAYSDLPAEIRARFYRESPNLDPSAPESVRRCYEIGVAVRPICADLYALQLRKALEAVCKDKGAPEYLPNGKRAMLWQQIDELGKQNVVGEFICKAAHELKDISNTGAHYAERKVTEGDIRKLEHLLALITAYVYGSKDDTQPHAVEGGREFENSNP